MSLAFAGKGLAPPSRVRVAEGKEECRRTWRVVQELCKKVVQGSAVAPGTKWEERSTPTDLFWKCPAAWGGGIGEALPWRLLCLWELLPPWQSQALQLGEFRQGRLEANWASCLGGGLALGSSNTVKYMQQHGATGTPLQVL